MKQSDFEKFMIKNKEKIRFIANANTTRNNKCQTVITKDDEWRSDDCWDRHYEDLKNKQICQMCFESPVIENSKLCKECQDACNDYDDVSFEELISNMEGSEQHC